MEYNKMIKVQVLDMSSDRSSGEMRCSTHALTIEAWADKTASQMETKMMYVFFEPVNNYVFPILYAEAQRNVVPSQLRCPGKNKTDKNPIKSASYANRESNPPTTPLQWLIFPPEST